VTASARDANAAGIVAIGCSAGGVEALIRILPTLPSDFPHSVVVVIHLAPDRDALLPRLFEPRCALAVKEAEDKESIVPGTIYFAPPGYHLQVEPDRSFSLSVDEPVLYSRPSIDVTFETVARAYGPRALGVVLTGASADGAQGLRAIVECGGTAIVQDPASAEQPAMPNAALESLSRVDSHTVLPIDQIAGTIAKGGPWIR
jgi:two-component system chemotaxis response regulator CheB